MKRTGAMLLGLMLSVALLTASAATGDVLYTHPGTMLDAGDTKLNFYCIGTGAPTVVFDSGWEDWSPAWVLVQPVIAKHTRACSYDRAGSGFSDAGPMPRTSVEIARELHAALRAAHIPGPYLLVGHSFGGYNIRTFADLYMPDVYGAVFVDIESGDIEPPKDRANDHRDYRTAVAELEQCRAAVAQRRPLPSLPGPRHGANIPCSHQFFRGLPMKEWSPALNATVLHVANTRVALYDAVISEMQQMPADEAWLIAHRRSFGSRPQYVLTAQNHYYDNAKTPPAVHAKHAAYEHHWAQVQHQYLALSSDSKQILVPNSGHYIELDQPQIVIRAILRELRPR